MLSQQGAAERFRYAQALEQSGDQRGAARIYQELYDERPSEGRYYDGVVRTLSALGQYASLVPIVERRAREVPSVPLFNQLALVQWKAGMVANATEQWQRAVAAAGDDEEAIASIAEAQMQAGATQLALPTYERARKVSGRPRAYAFVVGKIALASRDPVRATREFLDDYRDRGDFVQTQGQLAAVMATEEGVRAVREQLRGNEAEILRLRVWFHQEVKEWVQAFEVAKILDKASKASGQELYSFAERARRDGQYDVALEAFGLIAELSYVSDQWRQNALYWYVRTLDQRIRNGASKIRDQDARTIIARYDDIANRYPTSWFAADAMYHSGVLYGDVLQNTDESRQIMQRVMNTWRGTTAAADAGLYLADLAIRDHQLAIAEQILQSFELLPSTPELAARKDMAAVKRADVLSWRQKTDSARRIYMTIASRAGSSASNDAFERLMMLQLTDDDSTTRANILVADQMLTAKMLDSAAKRYEAAALSAREPELRDRCRWRAATAWFAVGNHRESERVAAAIVKNIPESIVGDRALFLVAQLKEVAGETSEAIKMLTDLLTYYPTSILVPQARERIRSLRGEAKG